MLKRGHLDNPLTLELYTWFMDALWVQSYFFVIIRAGVQASIWAAYSRHNCDVINVNYMNYIVISPHEVTKGEEFFEVTQLKINFFIQKHVKVILWKKWPGVFVLR